ncbi:WD repeat-containing protein 20 [Camellia lanceoleosa]|uniref:WD repeat-containing protein 20 n=1 Tax=Camellia lanceoleosa TaxID=1840588 RepID=A0ACC0ISA9_9ERIC|nr:WD repeat-containing protein 20 [Camellia lanceoleosa]
MARIKPQALLQQSKKKKGPSRIGATTIILYSLIIVVMNPVARWHICQGSINSIAFSTDGTYIATIGRYGYLRVFDYKNEQLICGGKSYYGAVLCCAWRWTENTFDRGEDNLVQVWSMEDRKVVAWGEGHNSWRHDFHIHFDWRGTVDGVAFDSYWSSPNSNGSEENVMYRFGSVGQGPQHNGSCEEIWTKKGPTAEPRNQPNITSSARSTSTLQTEMGL